jgi:UDP:flavonoid glycosyltransferase YjiC (YdhE family)
VFAGPFATRRAADTATVIAAWRADVVVSDEVDFGSVLAAERAGLPYATVVVIAAGGFLRRVLLSEPLNARRRELGLPPDRDLAMLRRYLVLSPAPPEYRDPADPLPATAALFRPFEVAAAARQDAVRPTVWITLGTVFDVESGDLFHRLVAGVRDLPADIVVTVGRWIDPAEFGRQPANVRIAQYIDQAELLPRCAAVVAHGGSGTVIGALAHGVPMVLAPMGADQPHNARRCRELGVAKVLDAVRATPDHVRDATAAVLIDPSYREAAAGWQTLFAALPDPATAVRALERISVAIAS